MPLWQALALAAALWLVVLPGLAVVAGYRWQSVKPRAVQSPSSSPAAPEEGTHV